MDFLEDIFLGRIRRRRESNENQDDRYARHNGFWICLNCSEKITVLYSFCPHCGSPEKTNHSSPPCKMTDPSPTEFCPGCGTKMG